MKDEIFKERAASLVQELKDKEQEVKEKKLKSLIPEFSFREYERMLILLKNEGIIKSEDYQLIWKDYAAENINLIVYGLGSKIFGEIWGIQHLINLDSSFQKPDRNLDSEYIGQYDLWLNGIKLGVKACRAMDLQQEGDRFAKALRSDSSMPYELNFRQLRIESCDCFVLIGVWLDKLVFWVLSYLDMRDNKFLFMGQGDGSVLKITYKNISDFDKYKTSEAGLITAILNTKS